MTDAERIELLRQLKQNTPTITAEEQAEVDREVAEIDASIEEYNEQIRALEAKLANPDNYLYESPNTEERDMTLELLEESFIDQLQVLEREDREYKSLQDLGTRIFTDYVEEIATLNNDIAALERRIRKNDVAVSRNMRMQLSQEELSDLTVELERKRARVIECEQFKNQHVEELKDYGELITANNRKREVILAKQEKLETLKQDRLANVSEIDKHKMRLDQDELARLKAGVAALNARKESITYSAADKIDLLIADLEKSASKEETVVVTPLGVDDTTSELEEEKEEDKDNSDLIPVVPPVIEDIYSHSEDDPNYTDSLTEPSDLDEERKAEIEETNAELLDKKKWPKVKEFLKKHKAKFIAAGLALIIILTAKGCSNVKDLSKDDLTNDTSYTQDYEEEDEKEQTSEKEEESIIEDSKENTENGDVLETEPEPEVDLDSDLEKEDQSKPSIDQNVSQESDENVVELEAGEVVADASDIFEGEKIEYGDEVGKTLDSGVSLEDYTEEGKAIVELPTESATKVVENTEGKTFHETLEDFFGGPISITDSENSYESGEELNSSRHR